MEPVEFPELRRLREDEAVEGLREFISELEAQGGSESTDRQTETVIRIARTLLSTIEGKRGVCATDQSWSRATQEAFPIPPYAAVPRERAREFTRSLAPRFV